jgi:hypothetical protein
MRNLIVFAALILAACHESGDARRFIVPATGPSLRTEFSLLNQTMKQLCDQAQVECEMVRVGKAENDGTGDFLWVALEKIRRNFRILGERNEWRPDELESFLMRQNELLNDLLPIT